jgi:hypothetical protein
MKTLMIHCFDPRAAEIPQVAEYFWDEVYPGENILGEAGSRVGNTRTLFAEANAGGRAASALHLYQCCRVVTGTQTLSGTISSSSRNADLTNIA